MQLWVYEFYSADQKTEASNVYSNISIATDAVSICSIFFVGRIVEIAPSQVMIPLTFVVNATIMMLFQTIDNPNSFWSFFVWCINTLSFMFLIVSVENLFSRNIPKEIRGIMYGMFVLFAQLGRLICFKFASYSFEHLGKQWPFLIIGYCNYGYAVFVLVMMFFGRFERRKNKQQKSMMARSIMNQTLQKLSQIEK